MDQVPMRSRHVAPIELRHGTLVHEWHLTRYELLSVGGDLEGYRSRCGLQIRAADAILEPGRWIGMCRDCVIGKDSNAGEP